MMIGLPSGKISVPVWSSSPSVGARHGKLRSSDLWFRTRAKLLSFAEHTLDDQTRRDGATQVTYNGWPLYRYVKDVGPETRAGTRGQAR